MAALRAVLRVRFNCPQDCPALPATCQASRLTVASRPMAASILLVEDDEDDALLITQGFESIGVSGALQRVKDGEEAVNYFRGIGQYAQRDLHPLPTLVLLDLQLPKMSGLEVLKWMRDQPGLKTVIVV